MRIIPGGLAAFNSLAYGALQPETIQFFNHQIANAPQAVGQYADMFRQATQSIYQDFVSDEALKKARLALSYSNVEEQRDAITTITLLESFQTAQSQMQRWIMANPVVAQLYNDQRCDGFSDTFKHEGSIAVGEKNADYRRVKDGIVEDDDSYSIYYDDLPEGEMELLLPEQANILTTWSVAEHLIKGGHDITNQSGGDL